MEQRIVRIKTPIFIFFMKQSNYLFPLIPYPNFICNNLLIMLLQIFGILVLLAAAIAYKYYFRPKAEIKRYVTLIKSLGYTVYVYPFSFLGLAIVDSFKWGTKVHKDAMYLQRTVYPEVDVTIGNVFDKVMILIVNPDLLKEFYSGNTPYKYPKMEILIAGIKAVVGEGVAFSEGEVWKNKRKLMSKVFSFDLIKENIPKIVDICNKCYDKFDQNHKVSQNKVKYDTVNLSANIFNGVMMKCFFGHDHINDQIGDGKNYAQYIVEVLSQAGVLTLTPLMVFFGKFAWDAGLTASIRQTRQRVRVMRDKAAQILKQRTEQVSSSPRKQKCTDIIEALVYEKLDNKEQFSYSDIELIDEFQTFLIAGTDTTTRYFTMIIYYLGNHPEIHSRVREEINAVIKSDEDITYENLKKLTYIDWIQYETTRMYGPVNGMFYRTAAEDNYLKDVPITKGTIVSTQPRGNHFNPKYFKDPNVFRPERWEKECDGIHPFALIGFSAGHRSCIGKHLAHLESKIALVKLIKRYEKIEVPKEVTLQLKFLYESLPFETVLTKIQSSS